MTTPTLEFPGAGRAGGEQVVVPDLSGQTEEKALTLLRRRGLEVRVVQVRDEGTPGTVATQQPLPRTVARAGETVTVYVSQAEATDVLTLLEALRGTLGTVADDVKAIKDAVVKTKPAPTSSSTGA